MYMGIFIIAVIGLTILYLAGAPDSIVISYAIVLGALMIAFEE